MQTLSLEQLYTLSFVMKNLEGVEGLITNRLS